MTLSFLEQHWALVTASMVATAVLLFAAWRAWQDSPRGRLRNARRRLRDKVAEAHRQRKALQRVLARLNDLEAKAGSVKPRRLREAAEAVQDAEALLKIAGDQVLIAGNHVRKIIVEEFPPKRHDRMRSKYLPGECEDGKPFSF
jgi:septal ring factor EnvC (AmiA/AmiB activator)